VGEPLYFITLGHALSVTNSRISAYSLLHPLPLRSPNLPNLQSTNQPARHYNRPSSLKSVIALHPLAPCGGSTSNNTSRNHSTKDPRYATPTYLRVAYLSSAYVFALSSFCLPACCDSIIHSFRPVLRRSTPRTTTTKQGQQKASAPLQTIPCFCIQKQRQQGHRWTLINKRLTACTRIPNSIRRPAKDPYKIIHPEIHS
jgi:hypothetical protein